MNNSHDILTHWAFSVLVSVVCGMCAIVALTLFRRWRQTRNVRLTHDYRHRYRPLLAKVLSGVAGPAEIEALRELPLTDRELLIDPLLAKRKLPDRCLVFLRALCLELGLIELWQARAADANRAAPRGRTSPAVSPSTNRHRFRYLRRAKSILNLGALRHQPSWTHVAAALEDRHPEIQSVAARALGDMGAPASFAVLRERLHEVALEQCATPPLPIIQAAMAAFELTSLPDLRPSLSHTDRKIRLAATEIARSMVRRESARHSHWILTGETLTPEIADLFLAVLCADSSSQIRARAGEVVACFGDARAPAVLGKLLWDPQWFVRLSVVRALVESRHAVPLYLEIRDCLRDSHWQVREGAIQTLLGLGEMGRHLLYGHFLTTPDPDARGQIVEVIERKGWMSALVADYGAGSRGIDAIMIEQLASEAAPSGLSGILRTVNAEIRQRFLERFHPFAEAKMRFLNEGHVEEQSLPHLQETIKFPPHLAA